MGGNESSFKIAKFPTPTFLVGLFHFSLFCTWGRYSADDLFQDFWIWDYINLNLRNRFNGSVDTSELDWVDWVKASVNNTVSLVSLPWLMNGLGSRITTLSSCIFLLWRRPHFGHPGKTRLFVQHLSNYN